MKLSVCMIVRDAEGTLGRALESVAGIADELVVVDTGSVDQTVDIARTFGAEIHHFEWCDDFAAARNYSLEQAHADWIFWFDADDVLAEESAGEIRRLIESHPARDAAFWVHVEQNQTDSKGRLRRTRHGHMRLFPNRPDIRFIYRVHEQVMPSIRKAGLNVKMTNLRVTHIREESTSDVVRLRTERNLRLLNMDLAEYPHDPFVLINMAMTLLRAPEGPSRSVEFARRGVDLSEPTSPLRLNAYMILATALRLQGNPQQECEILKAASEEYPDNGTLLVRLGNSYVKQKDWRSAARIFERALTHGKESATVLSFMDSSARAMMGLYRCLVNLGEQQSADDRIRAYLKQHPQDRLVADFYERESESSREDEGSSKRIQVRPAESKFAVWLVSPVGYAHSQGLLEIAETIHFGLRALGYDSVLTQSRVDDSRIHIVVGWHLLRAERGGIPSESVLYNLEDVRQFDASKFDLMRRNACWDGRVSNLEFLASRGIDHVKHLPVGYVDELTRVQPVENPDIDVLFYGSLNPRRRQILESLRTRGVRTSIQFGVYGARRDALIARSKIVLNLHFREESPFEVARVSYLLANRAFVISEGDAEDPETSDFAAGLILSEYKNLVDTCHQFLNQSGRRNEMAKRGFELIRNRPVTPSLKALLAELDVPPN